MLLPLKPKPRQTAAISGKQDFAQRRGKCRRDHQRLLSKLRTIIPRIVQTTPIDPKVTQGSRRNAPQLPAAPHSPPRRQAQSAEAAAGTRARNNHVLPYQPSGPNQQRPHRRQLAATSPQAGPGLVFRTFRRPVWRLVRSSEGAGQGATHGRGRSENQARPPPDRSHYSQSSLAIWTALVAAPLRI